MNPDDVRKVARALVEVMNLDSLLLNEHVATVISDAARRVLGQDRPNGDDDREYYALCDRLGHEAIRMLVRVATRTFVVAREKYMYSGLPNGGIDIETHEFSTLDELALKLLGITKDDWDWRENDRVNELIGMGFTVEPHTPWSDLVESNGDGMDFFAVSELLSDGTIKTIDMTPGRLT